MWREKTYLQLSLAASPIIVLPDSVYYCYNRNQVISSHNPWNHAWDFSTHTCCVFERSITTFHLIIDFSAWKMSIMWSSLLELAASPRANNKSKFIVILSLKLKEALQVQMRSTNLPQNIEKESRTCENCKVGVYMNFF